MYLAPSALASAAEVSIRRRVFHVVGHEAQNTFLAEAPPAPDLAAGDDPLLGQSIDGLHVHLQQRRDLGWGDYLLQLFPAPSWALDFPCVPTGSLTARTMPARASGW